MLSAIRSRAGAVLAAATLAAASSALGGPAAAASPKPSAAAASAERSEREEAAPAAEQRGAAFRLPDPLDGLALEGFRFMYRHEFAAAEAKFSEMTKVDPKHPAGYVFLASLHWWQFSNNFEVPDEELKAKFWKAAWKGVEVGEAYEAKKGHQLEAQMWLGGAFGIMGRWHVSEFQFIRAYLRGKRGYNYLRGVVRRAPEEYYDAWLGVGEFDYLASQLPGLIRIPALLFIRGDREGGLRACKLAAEKGRYGVLEARAFLAAVYTEHEKDPKTALVWGDAMVAGDPDNQWYRLARAILYFYDRRYAESEAETSAAVAVIAGTPGHPLGRLVSMGYYNLGNIAFARKDFETAVSWYAKGLEVPDKEKGWVTYCHLRRAQAFDQLGRRDAALADYKIVQKRPPFWDSIKFARNGLRAPPSYEEVMTQLIPSASVSAGR